ncbi:MAG TPA: hypothetical protein ENG87_04375 [Candidatus Pacearchaeota archaeon]|nr:30S ribosomal protein S4e [archaeon BMS3Abin17]HDK42591.1 hypothetical protein [Candidatus Pacearchaeota archaeon]HDZ60413.1 hypothetical protein [Candidatus Pacearchaeota archaeon]
MYQKRQKVPKRWPIHRKGTAYVVKANFNPQRGVPVLIILRDILKLTQTRKELKKAINSKNILLNNKVLMDEKNTALLFDIITIVPSKKNYRVELSEKGKFEIKEIKDTGSNKKIAKIINKKILKGKKIQLNLSDGRNFLSDIKCNVNDSVSINLKDRKIEKCLPLKEKAKAIVFRGKHAGKNGVIKELDIKKKIVKLDVDEKEVNVLIKQLMVLE